ncbi:GatB/YqeY domain-containing protein [Robertkochia aurantiaca]|uniref:GatB/YqeY domain-containing protein n=1 Tax=Robertkochia aurantiaca TaxID=2873700 RepID=UPI001CC97B97|nr:GatB/YqeY domain-containing protein [Robertkochia sp. 3YJGBD-33]
MSLQDRVMTEMKNAMKSKNTLALEALRAVKSELLLAKSNAETKDGLSEEQEIKLLQKLVKQRKESALVYQEQGREDLAEPELKQAEVIEQFLPEQMSEEEIAAEVEQIIGQTGADSMKDMGKVMGMASKKLAGRADGKTISDIVKKKLS